MKIFVALFLALLCVQNASAEITEKRVEYKEGGATLIGYLYSDSAFRDKKSAVIVFSDWMGVGEFAKERAKDLVKLGYVAFVADIYGDGKKAQDQKEAGELAGKFKADRPLMRKHAAAALQALLAQKGGNYSIDSQKVGAIGFCFGGTAALELVRSGAPLAGTVSFHGGLETPDKSLAKNIKGQVLALHGADDPYVPEPEVSAFEKEMRDGGVNWELVKFSKAVHAFTNPAAGNDNSKGAAYNEVAAKRAYKAMQDFFREIL